MYLFLESHSGVSLIKVGELVLDFLACGGYGYANQTRWGIISAVSLFALLALLIFGF